MPEKEHPQVETTIKELASLREKVGSDPQHLEKQEHGRIEELRRELQEFTSQKKDRDASELTLRKEALTGAITKVAAERKIPEIDICRMIWKEDARTLDALGNDLLGKLEDLPETMPQPLIREYVRQKFINNPIGKFRAESFSLNRQLRGELKAPALEAVLQECIRDKGLEKAIQELSSGQDQLWQQMIYHTVNESSYMRKILDQAAKDCPATLLQDSTLGEKVFVPTPTLTNAILNLSASEPVQTLEYIFSFRNNVDEKKMDSALPSILDAATKRDAVATLQCLNRYSFVIQNKKISKAVIPVVEAAVKQDLFATLKEFQVFKGEAIAEDVVRRAFDADPIQTFRMYDAFRENPFAERVLEGMATVNPSLVLQCPDMQIPKGKVAKERAEAMMKNMETLKQPMGFEKRFSNLEDLLRKQNPDVPAAIDEFNSRWNCSLRCVGLKEVRLNDAILDEEWKGPIEFVFINTFEGKDTTPIRLGIPFYKIAKAHGGHEIFQLLHEEMERQLHDETVRQAGNKNFKEQYELWKQPDIFDLPKGKTSVMAVCIPHDLSTIEDDIAHMLKSVYVDRYGATIQSVHAEHVGTWNSAIAKQFGKADALSAPKEGDAKTVLDSMKTSLERAIDAKHDVFVFHELIHGWRGADKIQFMHGEKSAEEIAKTIAKDYRGKPLCSQISIVLMMESCYAGYQLESIIRYLKEKKVPVKNLRIIASSNKTSTNGAIQNPSVVNEKMDMDRSPAFSYHLSYYYQLMEYLRSQGRHLEPPAGSLGHAIRYVDRMTRSDSLMEKGWSPADDLKEQDAQYYHYSTADNKDEYLSRNDGGKQEVPPSRFPTRARRGYAGSA